MALNCNTCGATFNHRGHFNRHLLMHERKRKAPTTAPVFIKKPKLNKPPPSDQFKVRLNYRGFNGLFKVYRATFKNTQADVNIIAPMLRDHIEFLLKCAVRAQDGIKAHMR